MTKCFRNKASSALAIVSIVVLASHLSSIAQTNNTYNGFHPSISAKKKNLYKPKRFKGKYPRPEFESKVTFCGFAGALMPLEGRKVNAAGVGENIFGNFGLSPSIGGGVFYNKTTQHAIGGMVQYTRFFANLYNMNLMAIKANLKYNFVPNDRKCSFYIIGGGSFSLANIGQKSHAYTYYPEASYSLLREGDILVNKIHFREPNTSVSFIPILGAHVGAGVDIKLKKNLGLFAQLDYSTNYTKDSQLIQRYYPYNNYNYNYTTLYIGLKFKIIKNKDLY